MNILVTGATGMVGAEVIREAILDDDIGEITALVRRPLNIQHTKLKTILHQDFLDYSNLGDAFKKCDACLWCLGISQTQVSKEQYKVITYDYVVAGAAAMAQANTGMTFLFLSGLGADSSEKSVTLFGRLKGKAENALKNFTFKKLYIARPGAIQPVHKKENPTLAEKIFVPLYPLFALLSPTFVITSVELARAMLFIVKHAPEKTLFYNADLKEIVKS
jgi:uncharacterized protein YbjT (DUF2867 family)